MALQASNTAWAQNLDSEPLFGSVSLQAGFSSTPFTVEVSPGGEDVVSGVGNDCYGYIRNAQPDFVLSYQAGESPLGVFALSDLDITMAINDPAGNWHCNDDSSFLSGTNSGIQFDNPQSGDYQIWVGRYGVGSESIATMLAITEVDESEWASISVGMEDAVYAASFDLNGDIVFGDDSSGFANDGECDDSRFQGPGAAFGSSSDHLFKDATDCRTQLEAGMISLAEPEDMNLNGSTDTALFGGGSDLFGGNTAAANPLAMPDAGPFGEVAFALWQAFQAIPGDDAGAMPLPFGIGGDAASNYDRGDMLAITGIDFGDNSGMFTDDGECDDPRFEGPGAAGFNTDDGILTDAGDCSSLYLEGSLSYVEPDSASTALVVDSSGISFGDNSSVFANDGECDDPRFAGPGVAASASAENEMRDANDCRDMFESGQLTLLAVASPSASLSSAAAAGTQASLVTTAPQETYVIGTPRGDVSGATLEDGSIYASGTVYGGPINPGDLSSSYTRTRTLPASDSTVDFGDNSSVWADDGECDDPRFEGNGMAATSVDEDRGRDAEDCRAAFDAGTITLIRN
ncbi:MAG: hypothetical protein DHS20C12_17790 [Pseudohongiella sp.]|nr:MAG: hypothetical protein DHS20C12_17790 [Pseudohongiella sp.]